MEYQLKCQLCGEQFNVNPKCPHPLGEHLLKKHPGIELTFFTIEDDCDTKCCKCNRKKTSRNKCLFKIPSKSIVPPKKRSSIFKTTVESWKPGPVKIICPKCRRKDRPCIRKQRNKVAYSSLGAFCMLTCWPICFLPFLIPNGSVLELFCKHCGTLLGEYDRKTGTIKCVCNRNADDLTKMC
ncbi:unnamed protein product [Phaedon cochleariae]|uniref:LITAF domain-containing protein n=1 Tax=Phaedon cochleariae TaxID=80249 RepID=A0A9P0DQR5_PHACE|nr:unnamed protein product [Phaedon cochleariae]